MLLKKHARPLAWRRIGNKQGEFPSLFFLVHLLAQQIPQGPHGRGLLLLRKTAEVLFRFILSACGLLSDQGK